MAEQWNLITTLPLPIVITLIIVSAVFIGLGVFAYRRNNETILQISIAILSLFGIIIAAYVFYNVRILAEAPVCLGEGGGCDRVEKSSYSKIAGVHMSELGLFGYLTVLLTAFFRRDFIRVAGFFLTLGGFLFSLYLTYLELWVIYGLCQWCVASATFMTVLFILASLRLFKFYQEDSIPQ